MSIQSKRKLSNKTAVITVGVVTENKHKLEEIQTIFGSEGVHVVSYVDLIGHRLEIVEDGTTFAENAAKKVQALPANLDTICIADDSGIVVDALDGRPGIYSARYAGENATRNQMCQKLLGEMKGKTNRSAHFNCIIAIRFPDGTIATVEGKVHGTIAQKMSGDHGFGYDPIFIPDGYTETFGELPAVVKNQQSHRYKALMAVKRFLVN